MTPGKTRNLSAPGGPPPPAPPVPPASQPPSGDAPDLREALRAFGERLAADGYGWEAIITRETPSGEQTVAHLTTANPDPAALAASAPSSPATPAPLDVEQLIEALSIEWTDFWVEGPRGIDGSHEVTFDLRRFGHEVARAYANQEGGEPHYPRDFGQQTTRENV